MFPSVRVGPEPFLGHMPKNVTRFVSYFTLIDNFVLNGQFQNYLQVALLIRMGLTKNLKVLPLFLIVLYKHFIVKYK